MDVYEVVKRLVGPINPLGETNADNIRFGNLKVLCELVNDLVSDIDEIGLHRRGRTGAGVKRAVEFSDNFLKNRLGICE